MERDIILDREKLVQNISKRINADLESNRILGANVYVSQNGKVLVHDSFGYKTIDKTEKLNNSDIFRLASMTKPIIAIAIVKLIEEGKLDLFDTVDTYIDGFNNFHIGKVRYGKIVPVKKVYNQIRILDLLTHSSGLGSGAIWGIYDKERTSKDKYNLDASIEFYKRTCLSFEPYCGNEYSAVAAFDILAKIVEIVSGEEIEEYLKKEIFIPLEMIDTTFVPSVEQWKRVVDMHNLVNGQNVAVDMKGCVFVNYPLTYKCGGAGLVSTINDYAKFAEMLLNYGEFNGRRILTSSSVKSIALPHILAQYENQTESWGLGVRVVKEGSILPKGCYGWSGAYGTHFWIDPTNKIVSIYMKNSCYDGGAGAITARNFEKDVMKSF